MLTLWVRLQNDPVDTYHIPLTPPPGKANDAPFTAIVKVRSETHRQLILRDCEAATKEYD